MKFKNLVKSHILLLLASIISLQTFTSCSTKNEYLDKKPNIIFAIADDWGWPHASAYGDAIVKTPAFDRVASEGILFNHAYVSSPSCTPSRNAILTGQYHWRLGPGANLWSTLDTNIKVYPKLFEEAGYHVGSWRKSWGPGDLTGWKENPAGKPYESGFDEFLSEKPEDTPFCFFLGASDPHREYVPNSGAESGIDLDKIELYKCFPDDLSIRNDVADYYFEVQRFDNDIANAIKKLEELGELENTVIVVTGDNGMPFPRCKSNLYDSGTRVPLAIRWGANIKKPGRVIDDFVSLSDIAPTFLEIAGLDIPNSMTGKSLINIFETEKDGIVDTKNRSFVLHGKERHVPGQEENLGGYPCRAIRTHEYLYIRNYSSDRWPSGTPDYEKSAFSGAWLADCDNSPTKTYMDNNRLKDKHHQNLWELAFGKRSEEELYDCKNDPFQMNNLAYDKEYFEIKEKLSKKLEKNLQETGDPRISGEYEQFDSYPYYGSAPFHPTIDRNKE